MNFNNMQEVKEKLEELKGRNLPHMTIERFSELDKKFSEDIKRATENEKEIISEKLGAFYKPESGNNCIFSDEKSSLTWGIAHGTATDKNTRLDWRCYHYFFINGEKIKYEVTLQYHPDCYDLENEED